mgnify:CR=1 FL=1
MKKLCKAIFSLVLMLLVVMSLSVTAFAQSTQPAADIVYKGKNKLIVNPKAGNHTSTDLFGNFKDVMPGDTLTETVTFRNESTTTRTNYVKLYIVVVPHGEDNIPVDGHIADVDEMNEFLSNFTMTVARGGKEIFNGKPNEVGTFGGNGCLLGTFRKGDGTTLTVTLTLDIEADNTAANQEGEVDWKFIAEEYTTSRNPSVTPGRLIQTGQLNWPIWALTIAGLVLIVIGETILVKKKGRKDA